MGGRSSSSNRTSTTNNTTDNRVAADNGAFVSRAGRDVVINQTSQEAVALGEAYADVAEDIIEGTYDVLSDGYDESFDFARAANEQALEAQTRAQELAFSFGRGAYESTADTLSDAHKEYANLTRATQSNALELATQALDWSQDVAHDTRASNQLIADVNKTALNAGSDALNFASSSLDASLGASANSEKRAYELAARSLDDVSAAYADAAAQTERARGDAFQFSKSALTEVSGALANAMEKNQEDTTQILEKLIKIAIPAAALVMIMR